MKTFILIALLAGLAAVSSAHASHRAHIAVANRAAGSLGFEAEPMYISQVALPAGELRGCGGS